MKKLVSRGTLETAKRILRRGSVCDNCLGRQFAQISTGTTNRDRGRTIREALGEAEAKGRCIICDGVFRDIGRYAREAVRALEDMEFGSFVVGTVMSPDLIEREESLWEDVGIEHCETFKAESNRELGKILEKETKRKVDERNPDVNVILNLERKRIELRINPMFVYGEYRKLARGIPQTRLEGYRETVEGIIAGPFMTESRGSGHSMHAAGREDMDARCLDWRPFVLEVTEPRRRKLNLAGIAKRINIGGKVKVRGLDFSDRGEVARVKSLRPDKTYRAVVSFENPLGRDLDMIKRIMGKVRQKTPKRVLRSRADRTRMRKVKAIEWKRISNKKLEIKIKGESGLYIKELITGDGGRTAPSVAGVLKNPARIEALDVIRIHLKE
jgi:tRNA pseudouridine synthase 10